jgi:hypothetical protein
MPNDLSTSIFERALNEAIDLLAAARFNTRAGWYQQGELSAVTVMVSPAKEEGATRVQVFCHDPGHMGIDWDGILLLLIDPKTGDQRPGFLDARGRVEFTVRIPSENELGLLAVPVKSLARVEVPAEMLRGPGFAPAQGRPPISNVSGRSPDGAISAVAEVVGQGRFTIRVQAHTPEMLYAEVQVILRSKVDPSDVWLSKTIQLDLNNGERGTWSGQLGRGNLQHRPSDAMLLVFPCKRK